MSLQHVVLFHFPSDLPAKEEADLRARVAAWPAEIGGMTAIRFGRALWTDRTRGHQYLLYMEFPDEAALRSYQQHPRHLEFAAWVAGLGNTALAFDYPLDDTTVIL